MDRQPRISWPSKQLVTREAERRVMSWLTPRGFWTHLDDEIMLTTAAAIDAATHQESMTLPQVAFLRQGLLIDAAYYGSARWKTAATQKLARRLVEKYDGNMLHVAYVLNIPPCKLCKICGIPRADPRWAQAVKHDSITRPCPPEQKLNATRLEQRVQDILQDWKILFRTETDILNESKEKKQPAKTTPDILLMHAISINGQQVCWIEVKNMYGTASCKMFTQNLRQQTERYVKTYGPGAVVFSMGFCDNLLACLNRAVLVLSL